MLHISVSASSLPSLHRPASIKWGGAAQGCARGPREILGFIFKKEKYIPKIIFWFCRREYSST
jgi:hypothetical protein